MSADALKKFLEDTQGHPDTTVVKIGDTEVPLGSLRQLNASERESLSERIKATETKETELNTRQQAIVDLAQKAQAAYQAAEEARAKAGQRQPNPSEDPFADPWLAPVKTALTERDKKIDELSKLAQSLQATLGQAATVFMKREWQREYDGLDFGKRDKKPTRDDILKYAQENKITDGDGMPSVRLAWNKMSEGDRLEDARREALEKGREEGRMEAMASRFTPPGTPGAGQGPITSKKVTPDTDVLGDLYTDALKDPELRALIEQTGVV